METQTSGNGNVVVNVVSGDGSGVSDVKEKADVADVNGRRKKIPVPGWINQYANALHMTTRDAQKELAEKLGFPPKSIGLT